MSAPLHGPPLAGAVAITFSGGVLRVNIGTPTMGERESQHIASEVGRALSDAGRRLRTLVLDLSGVRAMIGMGMGAIINLRNSAAEAGAKTVIVGMSRELTDLFRMLRLDRLCTIVFDEAELKKVLAGRG